MCGGRRNATLRRRAKICEMVRRVDGGLEREQRKDQDKGQRFDGVCAGPVHCHHSPIFALMAVLPSDYDAPADGRHDVLGP